MATFNSICLSFITTGHSSKLLVIACSLLVGACARSSNMRGSADRAETPPPHLRDVVEGSADDGHPEHAAPVPDPAASGEVSLGGIFAYADVHSPVLAVARSTRSRAEAARAAALPLLPGNPELTVAVGSLRSSAEFGNDVEISLMQPIQISGVRGLRLDAADRMGELTDAEIEEIRWFVHCDIHAAFHQALVEQARVRLAERVVEFQAEVLRVVESQIRAGEAAPLALRLAQAEVAQARQVLVAEQQAFLAARIRLAQLAGWPVATPPMPGGSVDTPTEPPAYERLLEVARGQLPSLRTGAARVSEAQARVAVAKRDVWPRPSLGVQYRREGGVANETDLVTLLGVISLEIPSFQRNQGERAHARADATIAEAELSAMSRLLDGQIAEARSAVVAAASRMRAYGTDILPRFEENLALLRRSFELGEIDILALSTGRERFLRIQSDALAAQLDYFVALASLERVVGVDLWRDDHHQESNP